MWRKQKERPSARSQNWLHYRFYMGDRSTKCDEYGNVFHGFIALFSIGEKITLKKNWVSWVWKSLQRLDLRKYQGVHIREALINEKIVGSYMDRYQASTIESPWYWKIHIIKWARCMGNGYLKLPIVATKNIQWISQVKKRESHKFFLLLKGL